MKPVAIGQEGELCIGGIGLARSYRLLANEAVLQLRS